MSPPTTCPPLRSKLGSRRRLTASLVIAACMLLGSTAVADPTIRVGVIDSDAWEQHAVENTTALFPDQYTTVCVWLDTLSGPTVPVQAFEFLLCYDTDMMEFISAERGVDLPPEWDYLTYRRGAMGGGCGECPSGTVRVIGVADQQEGGNPEALPLGGCIVELMYYVGLDWHYLGVCGGIEFCSLDCGDNVITSASGDSVFIPQSGAILGPDYDSTICLNPPQGEPEPVRCIEYTPGAICLTDPGIGRADINLNAISYEVGDAILFASYFIYGDQVWHPVWFEMQIMETDINDDGIVLTIADLNLLIRIITGDVPRYPWDRPARGGPKVAPYANSVDVVSERNGDLLTVRTRASVDLGSAFLVYRVSPDIVVGPPNSSVPQGMMLKSRAQDNELRIVIHPAYQGPSEDFPAGENELVTIPVTGDGSIELVEAQFSDSWGNMLAVQVAKRAVPDQFTLQQNFPNPFNAATVIPYLLSDDSWVTLEIFDVLGRIVARPIEGYREAGPHRFTWNAADDRGLPVSSGMYFYRLTVGDLTQTKKMILLK